MKKLMAIISAAAAGCLMLTACNSNIKSAEYGPDSSWAGGIVISGSTGYEDFQNPDVTDWEGNAESYVYGGIIEHNYTNVADSASSYFSLDRNTASYSLMRSQINSGWKISPDSVRIEEMLNYFDYNFESAGEDTLKISTYLSDCPWNEDNKLMLAGIKTAEYSLENVNSNYVFLIDVSGSMSGDLRLGLAKKGFNYLLDGLGENDVVSIVTYASGVNTVLDGGECTESGKDDIRNKISKLVASGATSGGDGLERAYSIAQKHFITEGNNRVIIITDGDFNVGMSSVDEMKEFIQDKAKSGVYLSVLGVGMGNMRDDMLETLATCGNGNYAYLDNENEARKVFVDELNGTLKTVATDAKACVTFTDSVEKYRLIGYDTKIISKDEFDNFETDTGEIGSNLCVTALYEITLAETPENQLAEVTVRCKTDNSGSDGANREYTEEVLLQTPSSDDLSFIACVAEFGLVLRNSAYKGTASLANVLERLESLNAYIAQDAYKQEFVTLVGKASESGYYKSDIIQSGISFGVQYVKKTVGTEENYQIIKSVSQLKEYIATETQNIDLPYVVLFKDEVINKYNDEYFENSFIVIFMKEASSGSFGFKVNEVSISRDRLIINYEIVPPTGYGEYVEVTDDMAYWYSFVELSNEYSTIKNVDLVH